MAINDHHVWRFYDEINDRYFFRILLSQTVLAEPPAVYRNGVLTIPGGAVIDETGTAYLRNIQLQAGLDGSFQFISAEPAVLAHVDGVNVLVGEGEVNVFVHGTKSACVEILEPAVAFEGSEFIAVLPESEPISDVCILVLEEYETDFPLDVTGLQPGVYTVVVNGVAAEFVL